MFKKLNQKLIFLFFFCLLLLCCVFGCCYRVLFLFPWFRRLHHQWMSRMKLVKHVDAFPPLCFFVFFKSTWILPCHLTAVTSVSPECRAATCHYGAAGARTGSESGPHPHFLPIFPPVPPRCCRLPLAALGSLSAISRHQRWCNKGDTWRNIRLVAVATATEKTWEMYECLFQWMRQCVKIVRTGLSTVQGHMI